MPMPLISAQGWYPAGRQIVKPSIERSMLTYFPGRGSKIEHTPTEI
jgi:hypothetical protein